MHSIYAAMAAARYSSDVLSESIQKYRREKVAKKIKKRKENGWEKVHREMRIVAPAIIEKWQVRQHIQKMMDNLFCSEMIKSSMELVENHYIQTVAKKLWEMGWSEVHEELEEAPYCEKQGQITKVFTCPKCNTCKLTGLCVVCYKNEKEYHTLVGCEEVDELEEKKFVKTWGQTKLLSEINEEFQKACIYYKQKEREVLRWLEVIRETRLKNKEIT